MGEIVNHLQTFLSTASLKAWVGGVIAALLTPLIQLLSADGEVTPRTIAIAVLTGLVTAVGVYATTNKAAAPTTDPATSLDAPLGG